MTKIFATALLISLTTLTAQADVLPPKTANKICRAKALKAAHFIADSSTPFLVTYKASEVAEISTPITFSFTTRAAVQAGIDESLYTVHAYAYPDGTCLIGAILNDIAGND